MVATPRFHVTQDATWVFVHIHVPFVRVSEMEFDVDGQAFTFYCKPYLLKLHFPHEVKDDELAKAVYDPNKDNGTIVVHLPKMVPGVDFPDLDMLTTLLQPRRPLFDRTRQNHSQAPCIEVLESSSTDFHNSLQEHNSDQRNAFIDTAPVQKTTGAANVQSDSSLLRLEKNVAISENDNSMLLDTESSGVRVTAVMPTYGFNNAYSDFFRVWHGEVSEILSLPDPDETPLKDRSMLRESAEEQMFSIERYLLDVADQDDDMYYQLAMKYVPFWREYPVTPLPVSPLNIHNGIQSLSLDNKNPLKPLSVNATETPFSFTDKEQELLRRLPKKEFLLFEHSEDEKIVLGGLVDILIGFVYDQLTTQGDSGVESAWTVSIISPTLSWLDSSADLRAVVRTTVRRMITFPFLRQYDLAIRCLQEASELLKRGKRVVLRALFALYQIFEKSETQYLLNALYLQDYCVWIQSVNDERLLRGSIELDTRIAAFSKKETHWALDELERSVLELDYASASSSADDSDEDSSSEDGTSETTIGTQETLTRRE
ncbi:hypothetical protein CCR75_007463 [Bremia lactucae]|uniref:CS domain-containing protein n=1 Tax=Bremia lactucae TaxID=4779 RepID=A0A976FK98_BRELC|nr:hypothetical protein CCR75_007463 [Bremia lactucae]